jgi:hypothetical protein
MVPEPTSLMLFTGLLGAAHAASIGAFGYVPCRTALDDFRNYLTSVRRERRGFKSRARNPLNLEFSWTAA